MELIKKILSAVLVLTVVSAVYIFPFKAAKAKVKINYKKLTLLAGTKTKLKLYNTKHSPKWKSSAASVVKVNKKGVITALKSGKATVTAALGNKKYKCKISVRTLLIGHRGYSSQFPENTKKAFDEALANGFDGIECDVWQSKNDDLMVCHDETIERFTGINKYIWEINKKNRKKFPITIGNDTGKKLYFPTFEETANSVKMSDGYLLIHLKSRDKLGNRFNKKGINKLLSIIENNDLAEKTLIFTTEKSVKKYIKGFLGDLGVYLDPKTKKDYNKAVKWCKKNKVGTLIINNCKHLNKFGGVKKAIKKARANNVKIGVYTVKTNAEYKLLKKYGAAYILSNYDLRYEE